MHLSVWSIIKDNYLLSVYLSSLSVFLPHPPIYLYPSTCLYLLWQGGLLNVITDFTPTPALLQAWRLISASLCKIITWVPQQLIPNNWYNHSTLRHHIKATNIILLQNHRGVNRTIRSLGFMGFLRELPLHQGIHFLIKISQILLPAELWDCCPPPDGISNSNKMELLWRVHTFYTLK